MGASSTQKLSAAVIVAGACFTPLHSQDQVLSRLHKPVLGFLIAFSCPVTHAMSVLVIVFCILGHRASGLMFTEILPVSSSRRQICEMNQSLGEQRSRYLRARAFALLEGSKPLASWQQITPLSHGVSALWGTLTSQ